jgi:hypothetical protein
MKLKTSTEFTIQRKARKPKNNTKPRKPRKPRKPKTYKYQALLLLSYLIQINLL